jgi:hypothetical protein
MTNMGKLITACVFPQHTMPRYDPNRDRTKRDDEETDEPTMRDVSHTPPHETTANTVWGRGPEVDDEPTTRRPSDD